MLKRVLIVLALLLVPAFVLAQQLVLVPRDQTVAGNVVRTGERIDIDGTVEGDAVLIGTDVTVAGKIGGDLIVIAQTLTVTGTVDGSVRAAARDLSLSGPVGRNVTVAAQAIRLASGATVGGSVAVAAQEFVSTATVGGSVDGVAQRARLGGAVAQDVHLHSDLRLPRTSGGTLTVLGDAKVGGRVVHTGGSPTVVESGAAIVGGVVERPLPPAARLPAVFVFLSTLTWLFGLALVGIITLLVARSPALSVVATMERSPLWCLLAGFLALVLFPPLAILLLFTLVGAPLAFIGTVVYLVALYVSRVFAALSVGQWLVRLLERRGRKVHPSPLVAFVVGAVAIALVVDLLLSGGGNAAVRGLHRLANFGILLWGLGGLVLTAWRRLRARRA